MGLASYELVCPAMLVLVSNAQLGSPLSSGVLAA